MSTPLTIATLPRITPTHLRSLINSTTTPNSPPTIAIIDVRDSDHIGGHILHSKHIPSSTLDYRAPELVRELKDKDVVVFHCMLSQQRGPSAALKYVRERVRLLGEKEGGVVVEGEKQGEDVVVGKGKKQKVVVLEGGFQAWQALGYGEDEALTEGYVRDIWE